MSEKEAAMELASACRELGQLIWPATSQSQFIPECPILFVGPVCEDLLVSCDLQNNYFPPRIVVSNYDEPYYCGEDDAYILNASNHLGSSEMPWCIFRDR